MLLQRQGGGTRRVPRDFETTGLLRLRDSRNGPQSTDKPLKRRHFRTIAEPEAEVNQQVLSQTELNWFLNLMRTSVAAAQIGCSAHAAGARRKLGGIRFPVRMGREGGECGGDVRVAATGAGYWRCIAANQFLELCPTVFADVFKNRHGILPSFPFEFIAKASAATPRDSHVQHRGRNRPLRRRSRRLALGNDLVILPGSARALF